MSAPAESTTLKQAAAVARAHVAEVFDQAEADLLLEEVEPLEDRWRVTISMPSREEQRQIERRLDSSALDHYLAGGLAGKREYKVVEVRRSDGAVLGVKVRSLIAA